MTYTREQVEQAGEEVHNLHFMIPNLSGGCSALINQNVYIGDDPVGHACWRKATTAITLRGVEFPVCRECADWIAERVFGPSVQGARGKVGEESN